MGDVHIFLSLLWHTSERVQCQACIFLH